jgi:hypothetical protein
VENFCIFGNFGDGLSKDFNQNNAVDKLIFFRNTT